MCAPEGGKNRVRAAVPAGIKKECATRDVVLLTQHSSEPIFVCSRNDGD
jgi:hypothetical protein